MSFFFCDVDADGFAKANPSLPLYPGKVNRWVIVLSSAATDVDVRRALGAFFMWANIPLTTMGLLPEVRGLELVSWRVGPPAELPSEAIRLQAMPNEKLPPGYIYATIRFLYAGTRTKLEPWPWTSRGLVIQCPEDVIAGVLAVLSPEEPPEERPSGTVDILENAVSTVSSAAKVLVWGGVSILLFQLYRSTQ